jgi:hypothetical protein
MMPGESLNSGQHHKLWKNKYCPLYQKLHVEEIPIMQPVLVNAKNGKQKLKAEMLAANNIFQLAQNYRARERLKEMEGNGEWLLLKDTTDK